VALATGETIDVSLILANESKRPEKLLVHRVEGIYVFVGEGFKNLYVMYPSKDETAGVDPITLTGPALERCTRLGRRSQCRSTITGARQAA